MRTPSDPDGPSVSLSVPTGMIQTFCAAAEFGCRQSSSEPRLLAGCLCYAFIIIIMIICFLKPQRRPLVIFSYADGPAGFPSIQVRHYGDGKLPETEPTSAERVQSLDTAHGSKLRAESLSFGGGSGKPLAFLPGL